MTTILNVDDTEAQRYATSRVLRHAGFSVLEAGTGKQALRMVGDRPDLVILDVNLPDMSGYEVCRRIRLDDVSARVPVVHLSATLVSTNARVEGLEGGADAYLIQPVEPEELLATVRALLRARQAEETLWQSEQQYRLFFEANPLACWILDVESDSILAVNEAAVQLYGYSRTDFMSLTGQQIKDELEPAESSDATSAGNGLQGGTVQRHKTMDGRVLVVEVLWAPLRLGGKNAQLAIVRDLTEKMEREQTQREEEIRRLLLQRVLHAQEDERRRIARELHDGAGQLMTSLLVGLRAINDARQLKQVKQQTTRLRKITSDTITELGRMARGLHSGILEDLGLEEALRRLVDDFSAGQKIRVDLDFGVPPVMGNNNRVQLGVYRVVQEALTNIARHSRARKVAIKFDWSDEALQLTIEDDGRGFELSNVHQRPSEHLGIEGMRQRMGMLGGMLEIESGLRKGTKITVRVPLVTLPQYQT
jgi:PAS domain S-box-containing protein